MSSSHSRVPDHVHRWVSQTNKLKPQSNPESPSGFVDAYADFKMPLHFDKYNPKTWPEEYAKRQFELGVHPYQQPPVPTNQSYGGAHVSGRAHHGGRDVVLPVSGHGHKNVKAELPKGSRSVRKNEVDKHSTRAPSYTLVPQPHLFSQHASSLLPSIEFAPTGRESPGIRTGRPVRAKHTIENSRDRVLSHIQGEIRIKILWPGYDPARHSFEKRIANAGKFSRGELLDVVCGAVVECLEELGHIHCKTRKEHAKWASAHRLDTFLVTRLHHWGGKDFQPEIWVREE